MQIRHCEPKDAGSICDIYNYYVKNTLITFEDVSVSTGDMQSRIEMATPLYPWLVCEVDGELVGYAYGSKWKERSAYKHTVETTIYVKHGLAGKGYGKTLYAALFEELSKKNFHVILGCIALPNETSVKLHECFGFEKVGHFKEVGYKFNQWIDVGYWLKATPRGDEC